MHKEDGCVNKFDRCYPRIVQPMAVTFAAQALAALALAALAIAALAGAIGSPVAVAQSYDKPKSGVEYRSFNKKKRFEIGLINPGFILNQSYVNTFLVGVDATYFFSETRGMSFDLQMGLNADKPERSCIENFYIDPDNRLGAACGVEGSNDVLTQPANVRYGPAYVPIREIQMLAILNSLWTPVYGKQLVFLTLTSHFDIYFETGAGLAFSKFYPKRDVLADGSKARAGRDEPDDPGSIGTRRDDSFGIAGRPDPINETHVLVNLGFGQKFHFARKFHAKLYFRNMTLLGTDNGFENFFTLNLGMGYRF